MQDAIFLTHRIPFPPNKGDKIRSYHLLRHLARNWRVHLGCFVDDPADLVHVDRLSEFCAQVRTVPIGRFRSSTAALRGLAGGGPLTFAYYASSALSAWLEEVRRTRRPRLELAFSSGVAPHLFPARDRHARAQALRVVDLVDLDSEKWRAYAARPGLRSQVYALEARRLAAAEIQLTRAADRTLLVSEAEAADLRRRSGACGERVHVVGNGVDLDYFNPAGRWAHPLPDRADGQALVFTGAMDYRPNVEGVLWFAKLVWPRLAAARPELRWWIVGARPDPRVQGLRSLPGVTVTGSVTDVRPWLAHATLAVVPLRIAHGVQNKLLEAMAMGLAVVATTVSATGVDAGTRSVLSLADEPEELAATILRLLDNPAARAAAGVAGRRGMEDRYSWPAQLATLDRLLAMPRPAPVTEWPVVSGWRGMWPFAPASWG